MVLSEVVIWMGGGEGGRRGRIFILYSCFPRHNVPLYIVCACFYSDRQDGKFWEFCRHNGIYNHSLQDIRSPALMHVPSPSAILYCNTTTTFVFLSFILTARLFLFHVYFSVFVLFFFVFVFTIPDFPFMFVFVICENLKANSGSYFLSFPRFETTYVITPFFFLSNFSKVYQFLSVTF